MQPTSAKYAKIALLIGMAVILLVFLLAIPKPKPQPVQAPTIINTTTTIVVTTGPNGQITNIPPASPTPSNLKTGYYFLTPTSSSLWKFEAQNLISWNRAGNFSGQLYLVNAKTKRYVGEVLGAVGPQQTSYTWNTRDLFVSRTVANKITVATGTYYFVLSYDGNHVPITASPIFTIVP